VRDDFSRADDLAQEAFIKAWRSIGQFEGKSGFRTWLFSIAYRTFLNDLRRKTGFSEFTESEHAGRSDFAEQADTVRDLSAALRCLTIRQQAVFDLHYKKGMTQMEVAEVLDMPAGTVKSDLRRGHEKLRELLQDQGFD
jgi:RNA polymerase sigma-70 factor (ECF subfamily)